jgi:YARHG domain-containing protein
MPSCPRPSAVVSLVGAAILLPAAARGESCDQLWQARNSIFAEAGHCFQTSRAIAVFGPRCYPPYGRLTAPQQARVNSIIAEERRLGCSGGSAQSPSGEDAQLPPPPDTTNQGGNATDKQLNEAASVWAATKDTSSPAVLEAYISRFGGTPFGDLARARLEEVKKPSAASAPPPPKEGPTAPGETELCSKYLPSLGRTVQAPCEP